MKKKVVVLSLGGSLIAPNEIDLKFLREFKKTILKNTKKFKFVVICGGGSIARKYIAPLREIGTAHNLQGLMGISITRINARFMNYFFKIDPEKGIPSSIKDIKKHLKKQDIIFTGGLIYKTESTTDSNAAEIAKYFKTEFINLTNVSGLYNKNPEENKDAKLIPEISWEDFNKIAIKIKFKPGQHFVLDQTASEIILKNKIPTYILGKSMKNLNNLLNGRKFKGTTIKR